MKRIWMSLAILAILSAQPALSQDKPDDASLAQATFAGGCFWCMEGPFDKLDGVISTTSGYTGGRKKDPTYYEVSAGTTGHAEAVQIVYDPKKVTYQKLLDVFWVNIDPTVKDRQFCDVGSQYRSGIYFTGDEQNATAEMARATYDEALRAAGHDPITTEVEPAGPFYYAEDYHQQYLHKVPGGYCGLAGTGVSCRIPAAAAD